MIQLTGYQFTTQIYESSNSQVYRGVRETDKQPVILKLLQGEYPTPQQLTHYRQEYDMTRRLDLAGVVKVYELLPYHNSLVMVLEDFGGQSLRNLNLAGKLSLAEFLPLAMQLCDILSHVHQQKIMHKDINPANVVYNPTTTVMKLIDFGISTRLSREYLTFRNANNLEGTLAYISPEQTARMNRVVDYRTDLYSLGVTLYELLTGRLPFEETEPMALVHAHMAKTPLAPSHLMTSSHQTTTMLSDIIMKLLAKNAEDRYQSAHGVKWDLEQTLTLALSQGEREQNPTLPLGEGLGVRVQLGTRDFSGRFQLPQKLYGREQEIETLMQAFARVAQADLAGFQNLQGLSELLLIAGYSGVGKSALVYELHKPITARRGHFIQGKFDQFQRNIPYSAIIQAFNEFVKLILTKNPDELQAWRAHLQEAAGNIGKVLTDLLPSLELIIGKQPAVPELDGMAAMNRFNYALRNLVRAMATPPLQSAGLGLVIFIDDWQWADFPSINLLELILTDKSIEHVLIIATYRENEMNAAHPLMTAVENLKQAEVAVGMIELHNLTFAHTHALIAEALRGIQETSQVFKTCEVLAELVYEKTQGNAFFVGQFLQTLYEEELLNFDFEQFAWQWDMGQIRAKGITDNVVDLLTQKVQKLASETQRLLQLAACLGNKFALPELAIIAEHDAQETNQVLESAVLEGLIIPSHQMTTAEYQFAHDRVQQAAYSLIAEAEKQRVHLQIGRLLLGNVQTPHPNPLPKGEGVLHSPLPLGEGLGVRELNELNEQLFEITNHWNKGRALINDKAERLTVARLNLWAGNKAKGATAYKPALMYYQTGLEVLQTSKVSKTSDVLASWQSDYELTLTLYAGMAEAAYLSSDFEQAMLLTQTALAQAKTVLDKVSFYEVQIKVYTAQGQSLLAVDTGLLALKQLGLTLPRQPSQLDVGRALLQTRWLLRGKTPAELLALPTMTNPYSLATIQLITFAGVAAYQSSPTLFALMILTGIRLVLQHGMTPLAAGMYVTYGIIMTGVVGDIQQGYQWGQLTLQVAEQSFYEAGNIFIFNYFIKPWQAHLRDSLSDLPRGYQLGLERGNLEFAAWCALAPPVLLYLSGEPLAQVEARVGVAHAQVAHLHQEKILKYVDIIWQVILNWRGLTEQPWQLTGTKYDEVSYLPHLLVQDLATLYNHKLILAYHFHNYPLALEYARQVELNLAALMATPLQALFHFYDSLTHLALYPTVSKMQQLQWRFRVWRNQRKMKHWAKHAPMNHLHKYYLVEAEWARVLRQDDAAGDYYDKAIASAKEHGYLQDEALACELASQFYAGKGRAALADFYLRQAYQLYQQWGAVAKCKQMEKEHPELRPEASRPSSNPVHTTPPGSGGSTGSQQLDLASVMKAAQTISGEIKLSSLLEKMMQIVMENAGAQRGLLILRQGKQWLLQAEATIETEHALSLQAMPVETIGGKSDNPKLSLSMLRYVEQMQTPLVLDDARASAQFAQTVYVQKCQPKSVLCLPLVNQGQVIGGIYLENNLTTGAFTPERLEMLNLLSSQMAISLENAQLYQEATKLAAIQRELAIAHEMQNSLLPPPNPTWPDLEIVCYSTPAKEVGGDFYKYHLTPEKSIFAIGDVSGKGVPASLLMATSLSQLDASLVLNLTATERMVYLDTVILPYTKPKKQNCALVYVEIGSKEDSYSLTIINAGCIPPYIKRSDGTVETLEIGGFALGQGHGAKLGYQSVTRPFAPGDMVILTSDGVVEANNAQDEMLGFDRLEAIMQQGPTTSAAAMLEYLKQAIAAFTQGAEPHDDLTMMVVQLSNE